LEAGLVLLDLETCSGAGLPVRGFMAEDDIPPLARTCSEVIADRDLEEDEEDEDDLALALANAF
jgi:hypothetical protein